jgi:hypothetical protein
MINKEWLHEFMKLLSVVVFCRTQQKTNAYLFETMKVLITDQANIRTPYSGYGH